MALTRKFLSAMGIEEDKVDEIIQAHTDTVNGLKEQRDALKADAEKLPEVQKELDELKKQAEKNDGEDPYEEKYNELKDEFEKFKADVREKELTASKKDAYKTLLKEAGVSDKRIDSVLKVSSEAINKIDFDEDGKVKKADELKKSIAEEWKDFVVTETKEGTKTATPPSGTGGQTMTKKEIMAIKDGAERRKAIAENPQAFSQLESKGE